MMIAGFAGLGLQAIALRAKARSQREQKVLTEGKAAPAAFLIVNGVARTKRPEFAPTRDVHGRGARCPLPVHIVVIQTESAVRLKPSKRVKAGALGVLIVA